MSWFVELLSGNSIAHAIFVIATASTIGLALGAIKFGAIQFGVAGVLFAAIGMSHFGFTVDHHVLEFCRELGLMLFVYLTGLHVGPGFFSAFKRQGLVLNGLAISIVVLGVIIAALIGKFWMAEGQFPLAVGLLSGATTNTPSLGAAQQALIERGMQEQSSVISVGYAVAYPFGVVGIILVMLILRVVLKINLPQEQVSFQSLWGSKKPSLKQRHIRVDNNNIVGKSLGQVLRTTVPQVAVSRVLKGEALSVAHPETQLEKGDVLLAVGSSEGLENFQVLVGATVEHDLTQYPSNLDSRIALITEQRVLGKTLGELNLWDRFSVGVTRITRAGVEFTPHEETRLQFADRLRLVGEPAFLKAAATELGDSRHALESPRLIPMFLGLAAGILIGSIPLAVPGMPVPIKLGLAGGPLLAAIILSRIGRIGGIIWHMPESANRTLREFGIVLFLVCVGLKAGEQFFDTLFTGDGVRLLCFGAIITVLPILIVGLVARLFFKQNYISLCGLLAGSMTDPPALAFSTTMANSDGPALSYATVYPMVMIFRIISTQILILLVM